MKLYRRRKSRPVQVERQGVSTVLSNEEGEIAQEAGNELRSDAARR